MDTTLIVILLGLISAIFWGVADFFSAKASKTQGPLTAALLVNMVGAIVFFGVYGIFLRPAFTLSLDGFLFAAASGVMLTVGLIAFFKALNIGPVSLVSPISSAYPIVTTLLALTVFGAYLSLIQIIGIGLVVVGILLAAELVSISQPLKKISTGPAWALVTVVGWGIAFGLLAQAIDRLGWEVASLIELIFVLLSLVAIVPFIKGNESISVKTLGKKIRNKYILGAGVIQLGGVFALNIGLSVDTVSGGAILIAISACYPILTIFLALRHFKESVKVVPLVGAVIGITGVVVLSLG